MHPDDPNFLNWGQSLLDQDDENVKFEVSDDDLGDDEYVEEIDETSSDEDYFDKSNSEDSESESEELTKDKDNSYFGKNMYKW